MYITFWARKTMIRQDCRTPQHFNSFMSKQHTQTSISINLGPGKHDQIATNFDANTWCPNCNHHQSTLWQYWLSGFQKRDANKTDQKYKSLVLVLELEMSVLKIVNLYFYRTSSQGIGVPSGPFLVGRTGAVG